MAIKIFITKKTHLTSAPVGKKTAYVEFSTELEIGQWLQVNRRNIINLKDCLLNRENLSIADLNSKVKTLEDAINGIKEIPKDFVTPIGIKTPEQIIANKLREEEKAKAIAEKEKPKAEVKAEDKKPKGSKSKKVETKIEAQTV